MSKTLQTRLNRTAEPTAYVVDDNPAVRDAIRWLVEQVKIPARTFASAAEFLDAYHPDMAGCLILDMRMPGMSGLDLQERLRVIGASLPIIIVTGHGDVPVTVRAMKAGAFEFLQKPFNDQVLLDSITAAMRRHADLLTERQRDKDARQALSSLTAREREVLHLLREGKSSKLIAADLDISTRTVEGHRAHIMAKLGVKTLPQLVNKLLPPDAGD
ncbi:MAG TPA: response regulator [Methylibium sp.]|nr:response regulator [Methylibium sp.]